MASFQEKAMDTMYPVYGFRLNDDKEDTPCRDLRRRDVTVAFFSQMSAHGPPHIYGARGLIKKVIWTMVTATALAWMFIQLRSIFEEYLANKVTVSVDIRTTREVEFPSITVCNLNAIRQSYLPSSFQEEFTQIESYETERVEQRAEEERQQQVLQQQQQQMQNPEQQPDPANSAPAENSREEPPDGNRDAYDYTYGDAPTSDERDPPTDDEYDPYQDPEDRPDDNDPMADPDAPPDTDTDTDTDTDDPEPPVIRRKREDHREKRQVNTPPPDAPDPDEDADEDTDEDRASDERNDDEPPEPNDDQPGQDQENADEGQDRFDNEVEGGQEEQPEEDKFTYYDPVGEEFEESGSLGGDRDADDIKKIAIIERLSDYPTDEKSAWGHLRDDFIVECSYDGYACTMDTMFTTYYNWRYGNCFAFNTITNNKSLPSHHTGPLYGLKMTFNIEQDEYVSDLSEKAGVRVLITSRGEMPFPEDKGLDIAPGRLTSVGIKAIIVSRKGGKYGDCVNVQDDPRNITRNVFEETYMWANYTFQSCMLSCYQKYVISTCGCFDSKYPFLGEAVGNEDPKIPVCSSFDETMAACKHTADQIYRGGNLSCSDCHLACNETSYQTTVSQAAWPSLAYKSRLIEDLSASSDSIKALLNQGGSTFEDNFAKLSIYYEELNLEEIVESPAYPLASFIADMGGTLGLWIGLSVLSLFEMVEFAMDHAVLASMKLCGWSSDKPKNQFGSNSSITPVESEPSFVKPHLPQPLDLGSRATTATGIGESPSRNFDI